MSFPFQFTSNILDVQAYLAKKMAPAELLPREKKLWLVRETPIEISSENPQKDWSWCNADEYLRIPLIPYCSRCDDPSVLVAYAWELGWKARSFIQPNYEVVRVHLSVGSPPEEATLEGQAVLRQWLGFAVILKETK